MKKNYLQKIATSILLVFICLGINGQINADVLTTNVSCYGGNDGTAWIENLTGTSPYSYLWSTGFTGDSITGLSVGNYSVEISDNNLDTINLSFDILEPDPISIISTVTNETQAIGNDGAIDITVSGGNPPYTFGWSNGASTEDVSSLQAGTYNLTVLDVDSCSLIDTFIVAYQNPNPLTATGIITDIPCYGYCNGYIDISVSGGNSPYSFIWSNGAMSEDVFTMCAGACSVTITDSNPDTVNLSFYILQPDPINIVPTVSHVTSAGNNNGTIDLTISGGTSPYNFAWSNGATTEDLSNLVVGTYMITITDANSCFYYDIFTVSFINPPPSLSVSGIINDVTCSGDCDGGIDLTVTGGLSPYTINWASGETTEDLSYLCPGIYEVTVSSAAGSVAPMPWTYVGVPNYSNWFSGGVYVNSNPADEGDFLGAFYLENGNFVCAGYDEVDSIGGANLLLIPDDITSPQKDGFVNGDFIYMKLWRISDGSILEITPVFGYGWACGQTFCNGGSSWVDFYGSYYPPSYSPLTSTVIFELAQPDPLIIDPAITQVDTFVNTNGAIDLTVSGGVSPYSFAWSNGDTTEDINNLDTGIYWLTLSDVNNCELYDSFIVDYADIYLSLAMMKQDADCYGLSTGSVWVDVLVGVSPFTFLWSNGMTADSIFGLSAGVYSLTATAANGDSCINTITIFQPDTISIGAIITSATTTVGNDGAIDLTISGGTSPYAVLWSNGAVTEDISQLIPGTYNLIISDANSCNYTDSFEVNLFSPLFTTGNSSNIDCYGICNGTVNLTVSGGNTPYNFIWSNGETSEDISNLCAGNYTATISDQNTVNFLVMPWNYTNTGINHTILIQAGVLTLDGASIQTGDYVGVFYNDNGNYQCGGYCLWNNNSSVNAVTAWGDDPGPGKVGFDVGEAFTWKVWRQTDGATVVMDPSYSILFPHLGNFITNGMSGFETLIGNTINVLTLSFDILEPDSINIISTVTNETQTIGNDGAIDITVSGGTPPYNYSWSNGAASEDISSLVTGTYGLTVMDANFCSYVESLVVGFDSAVSLFATGAVTDILCYGYCNGAIDLTVSGGYLPYSFIWSNGEITEDVSNLCANFYSVTIIDSNLDTISLSFDILEPDSISIISTVTNETQTIGNDGAIDITVSGGTPPYNYSWSNGAASEDISSLVTGTYG
ncbi:MAG: SprB repeat-containing protein, partial [Bacteroidota bacterium]|nr:SprB repeat-containing protein [Bacteroidota bacterium]